MRFLRSKKLIISLSIMIGLVFGGMVIRSQPSDDDSSKLKYYVFCVRGKVEIGSRTITEMKQARGEDICTLGAERIGFDNLSFALEEAQRRGGVGADCDCTVRLKNKAQETKDKHQNGL